MHDWFACISGLCSISTTHFILAGSITTAKQLTSVFGSSMWTYQHFELCRKKQVHNVSIDTYCMYLFTRLQFISFKILLVPWSTSTWCGTSTFLLIIIHTPYRDTCCMYLFTSFQIISLGNIQSGSIRKVHEIHPHFLPIWVCAVYSSSLYILDDHIRMDLYSYFDYISNIAIMITAQFVNQLSYYIFYLAGCGCPLQSAFNNDCVMRRGLIEIFTIVDML
jgi:hypothetical protein